MIKAVCIDDEQLARESIIDLIKLSNQEIEIVGEAESVESAIQIIHTHHPDLVFLDIQLADGTGFDLLQKLTKINFKLIFITAYEEFALRAIKFSAIDYLLKPINPADFFAALSKAETIFEKENQHKQLEALISHLNPDEKKKKKLVLRTAESIHLIDIQDIIRCEANSGYTEFYLDSGKSILVSKGLIEFDELLSECGFIRTHQSHLININFIESYEKTDGGYILMRDKSNVPVSNRKKENMIRFFEKL
ncbi:MAG: response regulator transcription factor [Bacteroidales bacterium]|nr:response regulator transcription factor [Bacteroidales bacterium]